jgi:hypothetical protein
VLPGLTQKSLTGEPARLFLVFKAATRLLNERYFYSVWAFFALGNFKLHLVILANLADEVGYVHEDIFAALVYFDEAEAFGFVEEFYGSCLHDAKDKK